MKRRDAIEPRLHRARVFAIEPLQIVDTVRLGMRDDTPQRRYFPVIDRDDELAKPLMRNAALGAISVERALARDAEPRLQAPFGIIEPGMDHLATARGGVLTDPAFLLEEQDLAAGAGQDPRHRQSDDAAADDNTLDRFGHAETPSPSRCAGPSLSPAGRGLG